MNIARLIGYRVKIQDIWEVANSRYDFKLGDKCNKACKKLSKKIEVLQEEETKKHAGGRPKKEDKKIQINVKLPPYLIHVMDRVEESRAVLIEKAVLSYLEEKKRLKQVDLFEK